MSIKRTGEIHRIGLRMKRTARRIFWPRPTLYWPFGIARKRGNIFEAGVDVYISGYPRSANTFATKAFLMANPGARVWSHHHIPAFVIRSVERKDPGMLLIRKPLDAAVSWAIHHELTMEEAVSY